MHALHDQRLVDEAIDALVDWGEECASVWDAYARWTSAHVADSPLAFCAYQAALDREERAAHVYAELMTRVSVSLDRPSVLRPGEAEQSSVSPAAQTAEPT